MTEKYADLEPTIAVEESLDLRERWAAGVALRLLDENPDQVPRPRALGPEDDDRIYAWHRVAEHPAMQGLYKSMREDQSYLDRVLERLTELGDQVPGRTITESELQAVARNHESIRDLVGMLGITVVPDPEPTNVEKMRTDLDAFYAQSVADLADGHGLEHFLTERGWTKAPGGDDES